MGPNEFTTQTQSEVDEPKNGDVTSSSPGGVQGKSGTRSTEHSWTSVAISKAAGWAIPLLAVMLYIIFSIAAPDTFSSLANLRAMIGGQATVLLLSMAIILPMREGDFDLSVSSVMILAGCLTGVLTAHHVSPLVACLAALLVGVVAGAINGLLVVIVGIDGLIATLGTLTVMSGLSTYVSSNNTVTTFPTGLTNFASHKFLGLETPVWAGWILAIILWYVFEQTPLGRYTLFIGGNRNAAQLAGLRVNRFRIGGFLVSGTLSAMAGLLFAGSFGSVDPSASASYLLAPFTAVFLGASAIKIGRFNVLGTVVAIYLLAIGITGLGLLGAQYWIADVFNGGCLIVAVCFSILVRRASRLRGASSI
jgi:ribose transport system permease protein